MADLGAKPDGAVNEGTYNNLDESNRSTVRIDVDESKAHLINANGGTGVDTETAIIDPAVSSDGEISFNGLGKEEVMRYAKDPFWVRLRWILFILFWVGWLAMLVTAIVIIVLAPRCPPRPDLKWYQTETVYQVFPKSFKDSNDDGIGDFGGLKEKLSYITDLGVKAIWLNSIFVTDKKSSLGVVDHKDIDASFGVTVAEFKEWLRNLRKQGLKVILDLIPNQTSKNHTWFSKSQGKEDKYQDYYIWAPGSANQPPNDWKTADGQSMWTFDSTRDAWYFHQFSANYPDLNLTNEHVKEEIKDIMRFWLDAGVSGFHIQGLEYLVENPDHSANNEFQSQTRNYVGTLQLLEELREVADVFSDKPGRERLLFGTVEHADRNQTQEYWGSGGKKRLHIVSPLLDKLDHSYNAVHLKSMIDTLLNTSDNYWLGLQLGNENTPRIASRLEGSDGKFSSRLTIAHALQLLLIGTPFNYYGDEFGQRNGNSNTDDVADDYRNPMQWNDQENAGFTSKGITTWLPVGANYKKENVQVNLAHFNVLTPFKFFKDLVKLRGRESFQWGATQVCSPDNNVLMFTRKAFRFPYFRVVINTGDADTHVSPTDLECTPTRDVGTIVFHSGAKEANEPLDFKNSGLHLEPFDVLVIEYAKED